MHFAIKALIWIFWLNIVLGEFNLEMERLFIVVQIAALC